MIDNGMDFIVSSWSLSHWTKKSRPLHLYKLHNQSTRAAATTALWTKSSFFGSNNQVTYSQQHDCESHARPAECCAC